NRGVYRVAPTNLLDPSPRRISRLMRAVVITSHGGIDGIGVLEVESPPSPVANRVRVRVHAAGLNRADILQRRGSYPAPRGYPQNIPGLEFAGELDLGLDASVAVGDTPAKFVEAVQDWTAGVGVDVILDLVGGNYFSANLDALASRGRFICVGTMAGAKSEIDLGLLLRKRVNI